MNSHRHTRPGPGESAVFHFDTRWQLPAGPEDVWRVLADLPAWPDWWPGISHSRRTGGDAWLLVRSPLGYRLRFRLRLLAEAPPHHAYFRAEGDLRGQGAVTLRALVRGGTHVHIIWCVVTRRRLLCFLRPLAGWAHTAVMAAGHHQLQQRLAENAQTEHRRSRQPCPPEPA